jgi:predicted PurR-regulated permease PerM
MPRHSRDQWPWQVHAVVVVVVVAVAVAVVVVVVVVVAVVKEVVATAEQQQQLPQQQHQQYLSGAPDLSCVNSDCMQLHFKESSTARMVSQFLFALLLNTRIAALCYRHLLHPSRFSSC